MVEINPDIANDTVVDHNKVEEILIVNYSLQILKLFIIISNISYLTGVAWFTLCEAVRDFSLDIDVGADVEDHNENADLYPPGFLVEYGIFENDYHKNQIISIYFAFTSLSTVGFGDYAPRGNIERFIGSFILVLGVAIFSYIMGNFISILDEFQAFHVPLEDGDRLSQFFGTLKSFNGNKPIDESLKHTMEEHFEFRWQQDKLAAFRDPSDEAILG